MSISPSEYAELVDEVDTGIVTLRLFTAAIALFCFDYGLTFTREVEHIWKRGLSAPAVLFYCIRYPALVSTVFLVLDETAWAGISDQVCSLLVHIEMVLNVLVLGAAAMFSALRAYALCWKDKRILALVLVLASVHPIIAAYTFAKSDISYITFPLPGCGFASTIPAAEYENWIIGARASAVLTDMVVLGITLKKARPIRVIGARTGSVSAMASIIMRDGVLYFGVLLIANLLGLILVRIFSLIQPMSTWIAILTSIMTSRFLLDLHEAADPRYRTSMGRPPSSGDSALTFPNPHARARALACNSTPLWYSAPGLPAQLPLAMIIGRLKAREAWTMRRVMTMARATAGRAKDVCLQIMA